MTKIKYSALVSDMSGKLNGSVASRNKAGSYLRNKVTPSNPQTSSQLEVRNRVASLSKDWASLTSAQRESWNAAVNDFKKTNIFGDLKTPSGFNLYIKINSNILAAGGTVLDTAPAVTAVGYTSISSVTIDNSSQSVSIAFDTAGITADKIKVEATAGMSPGINNANNKYRVIGYVTAVTSPYVASAAYIAKFGAVPAAGQKVFVRITPIDSASGQQGLPASADTEVVA